MIQSSILPRIGHDLRVLFIGETNAEILARQHAERRKQALVMIDKSLCADVYSDHHSVRIAAGATAQFLNSCYSLPHEELESETDTLAASLEKAGLLKDNAEGMIFKLVIDSLRTEHTTHGLKFDNRWTDRLKIIASTGHAPNYPLTP